MADRDKKAAEHAGKASVTIKSGVAGGAGIVGGAGLAGAGVGVATGVEVLSRIETAGADTIDNIAQHHHTLLEEASTRVTGVADERTADLEAKAAELLEQHTTTLLANATDAEQRLVESLQVTGRHMGNEMRAIVNSGERELHQLAQQLETEIVEQKERAIAEVRDAGQRAVDMVESQVNSIRTVQKGNYWRSGLDG